MRLQARAERLQGGARVPTQAGGLGAFAQPMTILQASGDAPWLGEEASTIDRTAGEPGISDITHQPVARNVRPGCRRAERCAREGCMYAYGPRAVSLTR